MRPTAAALLCGPARPPRIAGLGTVWRRYLAELVRRLTGLLGDADEGDAAHAGRLVGVYLFGSAAYGAAEPGRSDLDVQAVVVGSLAPALRLAIAAQLSHRALPCPARRLEFVLYEAAAVARAARHPRFLLNLNTGAGEIDRVELAPVAGESHWFLLDLAMGHTLGRALAGPEPGEVFAAVPRRWQLEAIADSLRWHRQHEARSVNNVLNACRGWRFAATGEHGSKAAAAAWARQQPACPAVVAQAQRCRVHGGELAAEDVAVLFTRVQAVVESVLESVVKSELARAALPPPR